jgi:drug/metabolite transporter (DMT)-like permease
VAISGGLTRAELLARGAVLLAATCYASNGVISRAYYDAGGTPMTLVVLRNVLAATVFWIWFALAGPRRPALGDMALATLLGFVQMAFTTSLVIGFDRAPVALVVLLFYTYPLLVTLGAAACFGERLSRAGIAFVVLGTAGLVLAVGTPASVTPLGVALGLGAGLGNALVILGNRVLLHRGLRIVDIAALTYAVPAVVGGLLVAAAAVPMPPQSAAAWAPALAFATTGTVLPYLLFYRAVTVIGVSLAALIATAEPFVAVVLAYAILGERLGAGQLAGGALIVAAIVGLAGASRVAAVLPGR